MTKKKVKQQFTLEQMKGILQSIDSTKPQMIVSVIQGILPAFVEYLKVRPVGYEEANEIFEIYLLLRYWSKIINPHETKQSYRQGWIGMQMQVQKLLTHKWLQEMFDCYREICEYLQINGVLREGNPLDMQEVLTYLQQGDYNLEKKQGKIYVHLDDDRYNEFGIEIKKTYFE
jgi:hypothetical protein